MKKSSFAEAVMARDPAADDYPGPTDASPAVNIDGAAFRDLGVDSIEDPSG